MFVITISLLSTNFIVVYDTNSINANQPSVCVHVCVVQQIDTLIRYTGHMSIIYTKSFCITCKQVLQIILVKKLLSIVTLDIQIH